jgi:hypothetical protein
MVSGESGGGGLVGLECLVWFLLLRVGSRRKRGWCAKFQESQLDGIEGVGQNEAVAGHKVIL